ncbi:MAG: hypothetical protein AAB305_03800 [Candidatus Zixiibacteriota bacterium]
MSSHCLAIVILARLFSFHAVTLQRFALFLATFSLLSTLSKTIRSSDNDSSHYLDSTRIEIINEIQGHLFNEQYRSADSVAQRLITIYPKDPAGYCFRAATLLNEMFDCEENLYADRFKALNDSVETLAKQMKKGATGERAAWMCLWIGHAKAHRALWESKFGSSPRAARLGLLAGGEYREGLSFDSTAVDIYAGLGAFHYWKSEKAGLLRMIRIFNDDREKGIAQLYRAVREATLSRSAARHALAWIYVNEEQPDSVLVICNELRTQYPLGKVFLWPMATATLKSGRYDEALSVFSQLQSRFYSEPGNYFNLIECDYQMFRCQSALGQEDDAEITALRVSTYDRRIPEKTRTRQGGKLREMTRYLSERSSSVTAGAP